MANPNNNGIPLLTTIVIYGQCQVHFNCNEFAITNDIENILLCGSCGCHRDAHTREETTLLVAPESINFLLYNIAHAPPQLNPGAQAEAQDGVVVHAPPPPPAVAPHSNPSNIIEGSSSKRIGLKEELRRLIPYQHHQMRALAEELNWNLTSFDGRAFRADFVRIGVSARVFKSWVRRNKALYANQNPSSSSD